MSKKKTFEGASEKDKKRFAQFLSEDEELVLATGYGKTFLRQKLLFYIIFPGIIFIIGVAVYFYFIGINPGYGMLAGMGIATVIAIIKTLHFYHSHRYLLTTRRVIIKTGFFSVKLSAALFDKITHIEVDQSFFDRVLMHYGNVIINTAGMNKEGLKIEYIDNPMEFKNLLERLINRERERYDRRASSNYDPEAIEGELVEE